MPLSVGIPFLYTDTPICWRRFSEFFVTIPKASTTTGVTVTFTRHNRATSLLKSWYFSNSSFSFSPMRASPRYRFVSYIRHCPCYLSKNTMSGLRYSMTWSISMVPQQLSVIRLHNSLWEVFIPYIRMRHVSAYLALRLRYGWRCCTRALERWDRISHSLWIVLSCHRSHSLLRFSIVFSLQAVVHS